jgi:hypothetical protein
MALGSTQPLVKMSTRDVPGGKGGRCVRLTTYHHIVPMSRNLGALTLLDPSGPAWPVMGVLYLYLLLNTTWDKNVYFPLAVTDTRYLIKLTVSNVSNRQCSTEMPQAVTECLGSMHRPMAGHKNYLIIQTELELGIISQAVCLWQF